MTIIGNRVAIVGVSAAGKSTLARRLHDKLGLPLHHTDTFIWENGWGNVKSNDEIVDYVDTILNKPCWLLEGYIGYDVLPDCRLRPADMIIVLDYKPTLLAWRFLKRRYIFRNRNRPELPVNCTETFNWGTIKKSLEFFREDRNKNLREWIRYIDPAKLLVFHNPDTPTHWLENNDF